MNDTYLLAVGLVIMAAAIILYVWLVAGMMKESRLSPVIRKRSGKASGKNRAKGFAAVGLKDNRIRIGAALGFMVSMYLVTASLLPAACISLLVLMGDDTLKAYLSGKAKTTLIRQQLHLNELIRAKYYETGMADEALYEACLELEEAEAAVRTQGEKMYEAMASADPERALFEYRESAPNRYLKLLLNLIYMTREFGDAKVEGQSVLMKNLTYLSDEIRLELKKRKQLGYGLKSLNAIVLLPLAAMWPIASYAGERFEPLKGIYNGPTGYVLAGMTVACVVLCYYMLRRFQRVDGFSAGAGVKGSMRSSRKERSILKRVGRKGGCGLAFGAVAVVLLAGYHVAEGRWPHSWFEGVAVAVAILAGSRWPSLSDRLDARLYRQEAEGEMHGFMGIVLMLMHHERMAVEDVVEWMEMYSDYAKEPLQRCLNEMTSGEEEALERLDKAVGQVEFSRIVGKLRQATMDLTLAQAFDEMEREKSFFYEMRKEQDQRQVERKMSLGKSVGFVPMHVMVIAYVAAPMLLVSFREMEGYYGSLF